MIPCGITRLERVKEKSHCRAGNRTRDHLVSSQWLDLSAAKMLGVTVFSLSTRVASSMNQLDWMMSNLLDVKVTSFTQENRFPHIDSSIGSLYQKSLVVTRFIGFSKGVVPINISDIKSLFNFFNFSNNFPSYILLFKVDVKSETLSTWLLWLL